MITIDMNDQAFTTQIQALAVQLKDPNKLTRALGREAATQLKTHFRTKDKTDKNYLSPRRQHFWRQVAASVQNPKVNSDASAVIVSINHPAFAQKVKGGTIRPKRAKMLTIPASEEAYGRTASTFEDATGLKLIFIRTGGKGANPFANAVLATRRGGGLQVEYVLKASVTQKPDPTALPPRAQMQAAIVKRADAYVARTNNPQSPAA